MRTRANLVPNLDYETRKKKEHDTCDIKIQQGFIAKNNFKKKKGCDKKNVLKIGVEQIKGNRNSTSIISIGHLAQKSFSKKFQHTCDPCVCMCEL
jgi:hypothetical protein